MEAIIKAIFGLGNEVLDRTWIRMTDGFFTAFLFILVGTPILANWGWSLAILILMLFFFVSWLVVTLRLRNIVAVGGIGLAVGVPVEGDAAKISLDVLAKFFRAVFLVLIWAEVYMAVYFHLPALAKEWWMVGSAIALMLVITPLVIYAVSTGMMMVGPWHRPIIKGCVFFAALIALSALPSIPVTVWTGLGINPIAFSTPETSDTAQKLRDQSYKNLVAKKNAELKKLDAKVLKGEVLSQKELEEIRTLEQEVVNSVPDIPSNRIGTTIKNAGGAYATYVIAGVLVLVLFMLFKGKRQSGTQATPAAKKTSSSFPWFRLIFLGLIVYVAYTHRSTIEGWFESVSAVHTQPSANEAQSKGPIAVPRRNFIMESEWGEIALRKIVPNPVLQNMEPIVPIVKGSHSGNRPVPGFSWVNDGSSISLIIEPDPKDEWKDIILRQQLMCNEEFADGSWGCSTSWFSRGNSATKGIAYLSSKNGSRTIALHDENDEHIISYGIVSKK